MGNPAIRDYKKRRYTHSISSKYKNWEGSKEDAKKVFGILLDCYLSKDALEKIAVNEEEKTLEIKILDFIKDSVSEKEVRDSYGAWFPEKIEYELPDKTEKRTISRESLEVKKLNSMRAEQH